MKSKRSNLDGGRGTRLLCDVRQPISAETKIPIALSKPDLDSESSSLSKKNLQPCSGANLNAKPETMLNFSILAIPPSTDVKFAEKTETTPQGDLITSTCLKDLILAGVANVVTTAAEKSKEDGHLQGSPLQRNRVKKGSLLFSISWGYF